MSQLSTPVLSQPSNRLDPLRRWWARHGARVLDVSIVGLALYALLKLGSEFRRLILWTGPGPMDLGWFHTMVPRWAAGLDVYNGGIPSSYPPATFPLLYPLVGGLTLGAASWLWATLDAIALVWLAFTFSRHGGGVTRRERWFTALWPLAANATGVAIGNGQPTLFVLAMLLGSALRLRMSRGLTRELMVGAMFLFALAKPNIAVPFFWMVLFVPSSIRTAIVIVIGYAVLTMFAASFQPASVVSLFALAAANGARVAGRNGYLDLSLWLHQSGYPQLLLPAAVLVLAALGVWAYRRRDADIWVLLGVTGIVARLWTYHSVYDDVLILPAMLALFRLAKANTGDTGVVAGLLLGLNVASMLALGSWTSERSPMFLATATIHAAVWITTLGFLVFCSRGPAATGLASTPAHPAPA